MRGETDAADGPARDEHAAAETVVDCEDVTHEYGREGGASVLPWRGRDGAATTTALGGVSLTVSRGEVVGIAGPSGSGKSTLLHLLAGLETPSAGRVRLLGTDLSSIPAVRRTRLRHRHVGLVFQRFHLVSSLSARANVALPLVESGVKRSRRRARATELLEAVGLGDRIGHTPSQLSGGEQQRVAVARALVTDPDLVLADEPTGELDSETGRQVLDVLTDLTDDRAVVVASHDESALAVADRVRHLRDGRIVSDEPG